LAPGHKTVSTLAEVDGWVISARAGGGTVILGVAGFQNSGKTTLLEILIPMVTKAGFRVATVKHVAHDDLQIDTAGTDTDRHKKAGARLAVAVSDSESVYFHGQPQTLEEILARVRALEAPDLILVEGFKGSSIPKIVVGAAPYSGEPLYHWDGSAEDGQRIATQVIEELRKERSREQPEAQADLDRRRSARGETLTKLDDSNARLRAKRGDLWNQLKVMAKNSRDETPTSKGLRAPRKRARER